MSSVGEEIQVEIKRVRDVVLLASIRSQDILQNLVVVAKRGKKFSVVAGKRRYQAQKLRAKLGEIEYTHPMPCLVVKMGADLTEISLAENSQREPMHPADEYVAFSELNNTGVSVSDIADKFGVPQKRVKQRLALARVAPALLNRYRTGKMNLECLMVFTITEDKERQLACYKVLSKGYLHAMSIREWLTGESINTSKGIGKFVGKAAYVKAGGVVSADLFQNDVYLEDPVLVRELAEKKLSKAAMAIPDATDWKWIEINFDGDTQHNNFGYSLFHAERRNVPKEEIEKLEALHAELNAAEYEGNDKGWPDDLSKKCDDLEGAMSKMEDDLDDKYLDFTDKQKQSSGCMVTIGYDGKLQIVKGLRKKKEAIAMKDAPGHDLSEPASTSVSMALGIDLGAERQQIVKARLMTDPDLAIELLHFNICVQVLNNGWADYLMSARFEVIQTLPAKGDLESTVAFREIEEMRQGLNVEWLGTIDDPGEQFLYFLKLSKKAKDNLVAYCVSRTLEIYGRADAHAEQETLIDLLEVPFEDYWALDRESYVSRLTKAALLERFAHVMPANWVDQYAGKTKGAIVDSICHRYDETVGKDKKLNKYWVPAEF